MQRWSAHSLRVGACVIPHSMGLSEPQLKRFLRWRSSAFTVYLQNTATLANLKYETLDRVVGMPYFLHRRVLSNTCYFADTLLRSSSLPQILKRKRLLSSVSCSLQYLLLRRQVFAIFITSIDIEEEKFASSLSCSLQYLLLRR